MKKQAKSKRFCDKEFNIYRVNVMTSSFHSGSQAVLGKVYPLLFYLDLHSFFPFTPYPSPSRHLSLSTSLISSVTPHLSLTPILSASQPASQTLTLSASSTSRHIPT